MWEKLDKLDNDFYNKYTIMDLYDQIVDEYNRSKIDTKIASNNDIDRFKRLIKRNYDKLNKNGKLKAKDFLNRTKIANNEILEFIIYMIYNLKQNELDEYTNLMADELVKDTYNKEIDEISKKFNKPKPKPPIFSGIISLVFFTMNARGYIWKDYCDGTVDYNANETYRYLVVNGTRGLKDLLKRQKKRIINKKKEPSKDKFSGALDEQMVYLINTAKLEAYKKMDITKCRFVAVLDDVTTKMCDSLNGKVFLINGTNRYKRWAGTSQKDLKPTTYITKGMVVGENLPPINMHFHWCRSTITYQVGD